MTFKHQKKIPCPNGCGRMYSGASQTGQCEYCRKGIPPPLPDVKKVPIEYLISAAHELARRQADIKTALAVVGAAT